MDDIYNVLVAVFILNAANLWSADGGSSDVSAVELAGGAKIAQDVPGESPELPPFVANSKFQVVNAGPHLDPNWHVEGSPVVALDLDNCLWGNLFEQSDEDNLRVNIDWVGGDKPEEMGAVKVDAMFKTLLLREGVLSFLDHTRRVGARIVLYTHSERKWAQKCVDALSRRLGYQFYATLLTREHCYTGTEYRKSIARVRQEISLAPDVDVIAFDDSTTGARGWDEPEKCVLVPGYDYALPYSPAMFDWLTPRLISDNLEKKLINGRLTSCWQTLLLSCLGWGYWTPDDVQRYEAQADIPVATRLNLAQLVPYYHPVERQVELVRRDESNARCAGDRFFVRVFDRIRTAEDLNPQRIQGLEEDGSASSVVGRKRATVDP